MNTIPQVQQHPSSVDAYVRHGWSLVPIPANTKGPRTPGWNLKQNAMVSQSLLPQGYGIGLAHAYSGTMAFDIDEWATATVRLAEHGIDLQMLYDAPDAVVIDSSNPGHGKLLYAMPFGVALPSKKIIIDGNTSFEFRCATTNGLTVQDVLPPSIHPDTKQPYRWAGKGHWERLPTIPQALLDMWQSILDQDRQRVLPTGDAIDASWEEIRSAVETINPDCTREEWISVGMALHWAGSQTNQLDQALSLWNEWSAASTRKYPGEKEILTQWASFKVDKGTTIKLGTLFHLAFQNGWSRPQLDASTMFGAVSADTPEVLNLSLRPSPPDIDLSLIPSILSQRIIEVSDQVGCDPLVPLFAGLGAVCGVADAQIRLELMDGYKVPPILWLMTLGEPADKKSPGSRPMMGVLKEIEAEDRPRFKKELLDWEGKEAAYASSKKSFLEFSASPEAMLNNTAIPQVPDLPPQPVPLKITVSDITSQKLVRQAADRPRGLLCYLDEMNSWVRKLTDKTSGEDRSAWVVSYEGESYEMDRVGAGSIHAENLAVSIFGNIQPRVFKENLASLSADGLLQRFIPAILRSSKTRLGNPTPEFMTTKTQWDQVVRRVFSLPAQTYRLSPEAYTTFREFQHWYEHAKQNERILSSSDTFMTAFGKLEGLTGRLILVFHLIEDPFTTEVSKDLTQRVINLVKTFVIGSLRYAFDSEFAGVASFDTWVMDHIMRISDKPMTNLSDIKRSARRQLDNVNPWQQDQMVFAAMYTLEQANWVKRMDDGSKERQHQASWAINPALLKEFEGYRKRVIQARQEQLDFMYRLSKMSQSGKRVKAYGADDLENGE